MIADVRLRRGGKQVGTLTIEWNDVQKNAHRDADRHDRQQDRQGEADRAVGNGADSYFSFSNIALKRGCSRTQS